LLWFQSFRQDNWSKYFAAQQYAEAKQIQAFVDRSLIVAVVIRGGVRKPPRRDFRMSFRNSCGP
jgi:hypothetical protein